VQFGTISKFGLMEMSRQRLRPALSEGASIPCPRCGGSGHIRDTESSALQILRIIQEEAQKDNTASVLCQVPVDVASFLLNEKRNEITKIELKQRINVLMVPSKSLETPNYKLERLKHDDPRLDHIEASYKLAEEVEDPTSVTRRSQEPTNKQTPVIKGVLPDAPAPMAAPAPVRTASAAPAAAKAAPAVGESKGFFAWLSNLFGGSSAKPAAQPAVRGDRPDGRGGRGSDGRNGRGEGRGDGRGGEARNGRGGRGGRGGEGRGGRGEGRGDGRAEGRGDRPQQAPRERAEGDNRPVSVEGAENARGEARQDRGPRNGEQRGEQRNRGDRNERGNRPERGERNERNERGERTDNRGERGPRPNDGQRPTGDSNGRVNAPDSEQKPVMADMNPGMDVSAQAQAEPSSQQDGNREKRSRDRYGRDRNGRGDRGPRNGPREENPEQGSDASAVAQESAPSYFAPAAPVAPAPAAPAALAPVAATPAPAAPAAVVPSLPKVQAFALPIPDLIQVAQGSGLQWVNSDAAKVAAVQSAIAAEPKAIHVPREKPAPVAFNEGPLVLVETKRDLSKLPLPGEPE
jgi:ribonuclease E